MDFALSLRDNYSRTSVRKAKASTDSPRKVSGIYLTSTATKASAILAPMLIIPTIASADLFTDVHSKAMTLFDGAVVLLIIFVGASWALGHRSKAIEMLIGVCCGYLVARNAIDIRDYLKTIGG